MNIQSINRASAQRSATCLASLLVLAAAGCYGGSSRTASQTVALAISGVDVEVGVDFAIVRWSTNLPTLGCVDFGLTASYDREACGASPVASHEILLSPLEPETLYHFRVRVDDLAGRTAASADDTFQTLPVGSFLSDDFSRANLFPSPWSFVDPANQAFLRMVGVGTDDARVELTAPQAFSYSAAGPNGAVRLTQPVVDEDFIAEAKLLSPVEVLNGESGIVFEASADEYVRAGLTFDGADVLVFVAHVAGGAPVGSSEALAQAGSWSGTDPIWLRVARDADLWTAEYSLDGEVFLGATVLDAPIALQACGLYAANSSDSDGDVIAAFDYIFDLDAPIADEDGFVVPDEQPPFIYRSRAQALSDSLIRVRWWSDEPSGGQLDWGSDPAMSEPPLQNNELLWAQESRLVGLTPGTEYYVQLTGRDGLGYSIVAGNYLLKTGVASNGAPVIDIWYGVEDGQGNWRQRFGQLGDPQPRIDVLGRLIDSDEARIVISDTLEYSLNGGPFESVLLGDDPAISAAPWRLAAEGDFNIELELSQLTQVPLSAGVHENLLELRAEDDDGHIVSRTVILEYTPGVDWPRTTTVCWSDVPNLHGGDLLEVAQPVDGYWYVQAGGPFGHALRTEPSAVGYDRMVAIGEVAGAGGWDDYEAELPFHIHGLDPAGFTPGTGGQAFGAVLRWGGHSPGGPFPEPNHNIYPLGGVWTYRWIASSGNERWELWITENQDTIPFFGDPLVIGQDYTLKLRCESLPGGGTEYSMKVWPLGQSEPTGWQNQHTTNPGDPASGSLALFAHHVDISFGDVTVTGL